ncbi:MAG: glutamyl-tRNA reductase [Gammaproteobacteria bacterium]|nr:glutamyl-tRNA reductase [Gammaproteobacteria bacterium]
MAILAYGLNFRTAAIDLRERIAFPSDDIRRALTSLRKSVPQVSEVAILSTCNRTELYCAVDDNRASIAEWIAQDRIVTPSDLSSVAYSFWDDDAARHIMRVAAGLDSQVLGEPQIMGQVKTAYDVARDVGTLGPQLNLLSQITLNVAKQVRSETDIGRNPVSVAYAAVVMAQQIFSTLTDTRALLIGAGQTIELVAKHLLENGVKHISIANRTLPSAQKLAEVVRGTAMHLDDIDHYLHEFDVVISSTGSAAPILHKAGVEAAIKRRRHRPVFMVDIAVPRDIDPTVGELKDVYLYTIDDLTGIIEENAASRRSEADKAEVLIQQGAVRYQRERRVHADGALVQQFRSLADDIRADQVARALSRLESGVDPAEVLERLGRDLTNKLIHPQTVAIRNASADGHPDLLEYLRTLYKLD